MSSSSRSHKKPPVKSREKKTEKSIFSEKFLELIRSSDRDEFNSRSEDLQQYIKDPEGRNFLIRCSRVLNKHFFSN